MEISLTFYVVFMPDEQKLCIRDTGINKPGKTPQFGKGACFI